MKTLIAAVAFATVFAAPARRQLAELLVQRAWMDFGCAARNASDTYS